MATQAHRQATALNIDLRAKVAGFESAASAGETHRRIARYYASPLLLGPPYSELLLEMVAHMYTDEEADLAQHLKPLRPKTAAQVAAKAGRPVGETTVVLDRLALTKMIVLGFGRPRKYTLLPIVPGTFEMALMTKDLTTRNAWHQRFAELFEALWNTAYFRDYPGNPKVALVRYLPVGGIIDNLYAAWPSDKLEEALEPYHEFAVGHCQCRLAMQLVGKGCGRATENCVAIGPGARPVIERGMMRPISREDVIRIKHEAEAEGSVTWMVNAVNPKYGNGSCSCCGCCCHGLRAIKDLNAPGMVSVPHFLPKRVDAKCTSCGKCVTACPMGAWEAAPGGMPRFIKARCIGCGLCAKACRLDALALVEALSEAPYADKQWKVMLGFLPNYLGNSVRVWARRALAGG